MIAIKRSLGCQVSGIAGLAVHIIERPGPLESSLQGEDAGHAPPQLSVKGIAAIRSSAGYNGKSTEVRIGSSRLDRLACRSRQGHIGRYGPPKPGSLKMILGMFGSEGPFYLHVPLQVIGI